MRRYSCDHSFFDEVDTEAKAYWLGFIAADGCVTEKNVLSISLSSRDHTHLLRFKADIQASHPVASYMATTKPPGSREARTASVSSISIASPQLAEALAGQGIVPRKTFVLRWPEHLPPELLRHFLRGYSDGDGCFHVSRSYYVRKRDGERAAHLNWSIIGTEPLCGGARRYLGQAIETSEVKLRPHSESPGIFTLHYGGNRQVSRIYHLLYDDATVFLPRKREVARPYALPLAEAKPYGPSAFQAVEMRRLYEAGQSSTAIGKRFGFSGGTVLEALRRQGVEVRPSASTSPFTEEQRAAICERYLAGESSEKIAEGMKISASVVLNILERGGIRRRSASDSKRKYQCDHGFFDAVDTEEQAYWLGFVASNGRVSGNQLTISCPPEDRNHLLELKSALRSTYPLRDRSGSPTFYMKSVELVSALRRHGVTANKRYALRWPGHLSDSLLRHYLRGYADGGGGFVLNLPKGHKAKGWKPMINFSITSTNEFLQHCQEYLMQACELSQVRFVKPGPRSSPSLRYGGGRQASRIWHLLYDEATVYLPRKREVIAPYVA